MSNTTQRVQELVKAAVLEYFKRGTLATDRLDYWTTKIRTEAAGTLYANVDVRERLTRALGQPRKTAKAGGTGGPASGGRYRPALSTAARNELERRVRASTDLIKLNREQAVSQTMRRFVGLVSSAPPGGDTSVDVAGAAAKVVKPLRSLSFEERRVTIDQGAKLAANVRYVEGKEKGAIAIRWQSNWRQEGYDYRQDHKERDGNYFLLKDSWAAQDGLVKPPRGRAGVEGGRWYEDASHVAEEPFCRCAAVYIYSLAKLPEDYLTTKGRQALATGQPIRSSKPSTT